MINVDLYQKEDPKWTPQVLLRWLVEQKGLPREIAQWAYEDTLKEDIEIPTHHGRDGFDNYVLRKARGFIQDIYDLTIEKIEDRWQERLAAHTVRLEQDFKERLSGGRFRLAWKALRGRLNNGGG